MILIEVRDFALRYSSVTIADVANRFDIAASAAEGMLDRWVKATVLIVSEQPPCGSACTKSCVAVKYYYAS